MSSKNTSSDNIEKDTISIEEKEFNNNISYPSDPGVTYQKIKLTIKKFVELGGGPFKGEQIKEEMSDLGNIKNVVKRLIPYTQYLGFMDRSREGKSGPVTYTLKPELREKLAKDESSFDSNFDLILSELCEKSAAYKIIWKYSDEVKTKKFLASTLEQYLKSKKELTFSSSGFRAFLNTLEKVKLLELPGGFISLEGINNQKTSLKTNESNSSSSSVPINHSGENKTPKSPPADFEGVAPNMAFTVNINMDYRQSPDLQREMMLWLERMASKPNVSQTLKQTEDKKVATTSAKDTE